MKEFVHSVKFKILIAIFALLLGITLFAATTGGKDSFASSFFGAIVSPFQKLSNTISEKVTSTIDMLSNSNEYYDENQILKKQINEMYNKMADYDNLKQENGHYEEMLGLKEEYSDYKFSAPCQIIGRATNDMYMSFFIDKGSVDGIELHDPVITAGGLVGVIDDVEKTYSRVTTILSPEYPIGAYVSSTKDTGVIEGNLEAASEGLAVMKFIKKDSTIKKGDIIVTSGHSGLIPKNRIVGTVQELKIAENGLSLEATIKPVNDIEAINNVFVITDFEGQGEGYVE